MIVLRRFLVPGILIWGVFSSPLHAVVVNTSSSCEVFGFECITGIKNLNILGAYYDMTVVKDELIDLRAESENRLLSWGNQEFAIAAVEEIVNVVINLDQSGKNLTTVFIDELVDPDGSYAGTLIVPVSIEYSDIISDLMIFGACAGRFGRPQIGLMFPCGTTPIDAKLTVATFKPVSAVPVPAALWLFGTAVLGIAAFGRSRPPVLQCKLANRHEYL